MDGMMPILIALITAAAGVFAYFLQRIADRKNQLINTRRQEYTKFIDALRAVLDESTAENVSNYNNSMSTLLVVASDGVIKAVGKLNRYLAETSSSESTRNVHEAGELIAIMFRHMRADCFQRTHLAEQDVKNILSFKEIRENV